MGLTPSASARALQPAGAKLFGQLLLALCLVLGTCAMCIVSLVQTFRHVRERLRMKRLAQDWLQRQSAAEADSAETLEQEFDRRKRCGGADETGTAGAQVELRKMVDGSSDTARLLNKV